MSKAKPNSSETFAAQDIFSSKNLPLFLGFLIIQLLLVFLIAKVGIIVVAALFGLILLAYSFYDTFFGLCFLILSYAFYQSTEEINIQEIFYGLLFFSVMSGWFLQTVMMKRKRIINDYRELWLFLFLSIACTSFLLALTQGHDLFQWFRYLIPFLTYLLYFPLVDQISSQKRFKIVLFSILALMIFTAMKSLITYKEALESINQMWEVLASRQTGHEPYFLTGMIMMMSLLLYARSTLDKIMLSVLTLFFAFSLAITFSRGYWIAGVVSLIILFFLLPRNVKTKASLYFVIFAAIGSIMALLLFGDFTEAIVFQIQERVGSIGKTALDKSVQNRIFESKAVINHIIKNPLIGYGLTKEYHYYNTLYESTKIVTYVHNAYLSLWFKFGMVGLIMYLSFYLSFIKKGWSMLKKETDDFKKAMYIAIVAILIGMLVVSITSPQFTQKNSILLIVVSTAFITSMSNSYSQDRSQSTY